MKIKKRNGTQRAQSLEQTLLPSSFLKTLRDGKEKQWRVVHYNKSRSGLTHILMLRASPLAGPWGGPRPPPPPGRGLSLALLWFRWCSHRPAHMWGWRKQTVEGWSSASPAHTLAAHAASLCPGPCTYKIMSLYTRRIIIISSELKIKAVMQIGKMIPFAFIEIQTVSVFSEATQASISW